METSIITPVQILWKVQELQRRYPENVYSSNECLYTKGMCSNGSEGCIVGQALMELGFEREQLQELERSEYVPRAKELIRHLLGLDNYPIKELDAIQNIQFDQDLGMSWGRCGKDLTKPKSVL